MPSDTRAAIQFVADDAPAAEGLARVRVASHLAGCMVCAAYVRRRGATLLVAVAGHAMGRRIGMAVLLDRYLQKVHTRHLAGGSLSTRHRTPIKKTKTGSRIRVQRSCNGCSKTLGDANAAELQAAVGGRPLPDVRLECGCWTEDAAA